VGAKGGPKTGGRKAGTPNILTTSVQEFVEAVLTHEKAVTKSQQFIDSANEKVASAVLMRLLAYRFGNPVDRSEHDVTINFRTLVEGMRRRDADAEP